jgi:hypothetical protein
MNQMRMTQGGHLEESEYAAEGTKAHEIADLIVRGWTPPDNADAEMVRHARNYKAGLEAYRWRFPGVLNTEVKREAPSISKELWGYLDAEIWSPRTNTLFVGDLKYGAGQYVSPVDNPQLQVYSVCSIEKYVAHGKFTGRVVMAIFQPRGESPGWREWSINGEQLWEFKLRLVRAVGAVASGSVDLRAGEWCRYCIAKVKCRAYRDKYIKPVMDTQGKLEGLTRAEISAILDSEPKLIKWLKEAKNFAKAAAALSDEGTFEGWTISKKGGPTEFNDPTSIELNYPQNRFPAMYNTKLKTPKQILDLYPELKEDLQGEYTQKEYVTLIKQNDYNFVSSEDE